MIFKPYYYFETGCAAHLFGCGGLGKCAVVDAHEEDVDAYIAFAASKDTRITHVLDTHVHADHGSGGPALAKRAGAAYCLHESADVALPFEPLRDGQEIELGSTRVKVLHTPGHTPESVSFVVTDLRRGTDHGSCSPATRSSSVPSAVPTCRAALERTPGSCTTASTRSCSRSPTISRSTPVTSPGRCAALG